MTVLWQHRRLLAFMHIFQDPPGKWFRDLDPPGKSLLIDRLDGAHGDFERTFHSHHKIVDDTLIDRNLPVGKQLHQNTAKEIIIRLQNFDRSGCAQAGLQIGKGNFPAGRPSAAGDEHCLARLTCCVEKVEQGRVVDAQVRILDHGSWCGNEGFHGLRIELEAARTAAPVSS